MKRFTSRLIYNFTDFSNRLTSRSSIGGNTRRETLTFVARRIDGSNG